MRPVYSWGWHDWRLAVIARLRPRKHPVFFGFCTVLSSTLAFIAVFSLSSYYSLWPSSRGTAGVIKADVDSSVLVEEIIDGPPAQQPQAPSQSRTSLLQWPGAPAEVRQVIDEVYNGLDGSSISSADVEHASIAGTFRSTYGEFSASGVDVLLEALNVGKDDVFCDLGSGIGKVVMQAGLQRRPRSAVGIELSETRHNLAEKARQRLWDTVSPPADGEGSFKKDSALRFVHGDITSSDSLISECTKIFFCSTVWPPELLKLMIERFQTLKFGRLPIIIASSRELKPYGELLEPQKIPGVRFLRHAMVDTSWGKSFISLYEFYAP